MDWSATFQLFIKGLRETGVLEMLAVVSGIISVWFSRKESIWVFPTGLINTVFYIYLSFQGSLFGEAVVNLYYTVMSVYGWWLWQHKTAELKPEVVVTYSTKREWQQQILFFLLGYALLFTALSYLKKQFSPEAIPWADAFASASAFTGMWLMTRKKVESWFWWILTNIASIPLYFVKQYVFTSVYYLVLFILAIAGWVNWLRLARHYKKQAT